MPKKDAKGGGKGKGKDASDGGDDKGKKGLKAATSINVRHILVSILFFLSRTCHTSYGYILYAMFYLLQLISPSV